MAASSAACTLWRTAGPAQSHKILLPIPAAHAAISTRRSGSSSSTWQRAGFRSLQRPARRRSLTEASATIDNAEAAAAVAAAAAVEDFCVEHELPQGRLIIRPVQDADVGAAAVLLTRAFATSAQGVHITDGRKYCSECLMQPPRGVLLVARLIPTDTSLLRPGQTSRVVATTGLSFCRATREDFPSLQPPDDVVYLANMAVDVSQRRQGYARRMLAAAEALVAARGFSAIYLHVRLADQPARRLYNTAQFVIMEQDNVLLAKLQGITPRALMCKQV